MKPHESLRLCRLLLISTVGSLLLLSACRTDITVLTLTVDARPVYSRSDVLVPVTFTAERDTGYLRVRLSQFNNGAYELQWERLLQSPASAISAEAAVELSLQDGSYRLEVEVVSRRSGRDEAVSSQRSTVDFVVDTTAPESPTVSPATGTGYTGTITVEVEHPEVPDTTASAVSIHYTDDGVSIPSVDSPVYDGATGLSYTAPRVLRFRAIDAAGNRSAVVERRYDL